MCNLIFIDTVDRCSSLASVSFSTVLRTTHNYRQIASESSESSSLQQKDVVSVSRLCTADLLSEGWAFVGCIIYIANNALFTWSHFQSFSSLVETTQSVHKTRGQVKYSSIRAALHTLNVGHCVLDIPGILCLFEYLCVHASVLTYHSVITIWLIRLFFPFLRLIFKS